MRLAIFLALLGALGAGGASLADPTPFAAAQAEPDYALAYKLATASYCVYALGDQEQDRGKDRAANCLKAAAAADARLKSLDVGADKLEAFVVPGGKDAYLLIDSTDGTVLVFRGTFAPPRLLETNSLGDATHRVVFGSDQQVREEMSIFAQDWINDAKLLSSAGERHDGFQASWTALSDNLKSRCGETDCSRFRSLVVNDPARPLYVTGHSKGGALATLAALDLTKFFPKAPKPLVYTFAGAKALGVEAASKADEAGLLIWRFEQEGDAVPSLPTDKSIFRIVPDVLSKALPVVAPVIRSAAWISSFGDVVPNSLPIPILNTNLIFYAHVGPRVLFHDSSAPEITGKPVKGIDAPDGDSIRLTGVFGGAIVDWLSGVVSGDSGMTARIATSNEKACRALVDKHFGVFSSIRKLVRGGDAGGPRDDFFAAGVVVDGKPILWGYRQWCDFLIGAK
jgi:hypothetical protein